MTLLVSLVYAVLCLVGATSCGNAVEPPTPSADWTSQPLQIGAEHLSVLMPDDGPSVTAVDVVIDGCSGARAAAIDRPNAADLQFVMVPQGCEPPKRQLGNGYPGYFRTIADVPSPTAVRHISTPVGGADVVSYDYYECTNACTHGSLTAAIITLGQPTDPDYPTLQVFQPLALSNGEQPDVDIAQYAATIARG